MPVTILRRVTLSYKGYHVPYDDGTWFRGMPDQASAVVEFERDFKKFSPIIVDVTRENEHCIFAMIVKKKLTKLEQTYNRLGGSSYPKSQWKESN